MMALPPFVIRLVLLQEDDVTHDLIAAVATKLNRPIPKIDRNSVLDDPGCDVASFYVGTHWPDPIGRTLEALDDTRDDWRDRIEVRATPWTHDSPTPPGCEIKLFRPSGRRRSFR